MSANVNTYLALVTSEHSLKPNYIAMLTALVQAQVDQQNQLSAFSSLFDVDLAVGDQLDKIGLWVGVSRSLQQPVLGVSVLDDTTYRVLLKLFIAMNAWDGTTPGIYNIWNAILQPLVGGLLVQDNQDMSMTVVLLTPPTSLLILAILTQGYFLTRPAGVLITGFFEPSAPRPIFGFDVNNATIAGFDLGSWMIQIPGIIVEIVLVDKFGPHYPDSVIRTRPWPDTIAVRPLLSPVEPLNPKVFYPDYFPRRWSPAYMGPTFVKPFFP